MNAVKRGVLESVAKLRSLGTEVIKFQPPKFEFCEEIFYRILTVDGVKNFYTILEGEKPVKQLKDMMMMASASSWKRNAVISLASVFGQKNLPRLLSYFGGKDEEFLQTWAKERENYQRLLESAMDEAGIDAILSPMAALPAFLQNTVDKIGLGGNYAILYNVSGFPAGVARVGEVQEHEAVTRKSSLDLVERKVAQTEAMTAGLPLSVQIGAKPWREDIVFSLINALHKTQSN